ncbi:hypothetical protein HMPREF9440_02531 [Sutterella parvirubra YIT 11816]|uniref:Uncharacterized protein n=1 Tax=Sutterella parvirubra YIT 11816 TaxID=762967 RepID=H3KIB9_9BURK|nr:hypothetical protein HMPREF9440_02531 [Sutterella parvirubra YIT 11816]
MEPNCGDFSGRGENTRSSGASVWRRKGATTKDQWPGAAPHRPESSFPRFDFQVRCPFNS